MQTAQFSSYNEDEGIGHFYRSYYLLYLLYIYKKSISWQNSGFSYQKIEAVLRGADEIEGKVAC